MFKNPADVAMWLSSIVGGGLIIKIVWDWLKNRGRVAEFKPCPLHKNMEKSVETIDKCLVVLKTRYVDRDDFKDFAREVMEKIDILHDRITKTTSAFDSAISDMRVLITRVETIQNTMADRDKGD